MTFIGDRFVSVGHAWLDIVTGRHVSVRLGAPPPNIDERDAWCRERFMVFDAIGAGPRLIDFGRQGSVGWFEAEQVLTAPPPVPMRQLIWPQVVEMADAIAEGRLTGHLLIDAPSGAGFRTFTQQLARRLRDIGFVTVRADASLPYRLRRQLMHRHVALLVVNGASQAFAAGWLAQLALVSDRRHLVIERVMETARPSVRLVPFAEQTLIDAVVDGSVSATSDEIGLASARSRGWPAAFVRELAGSAAPVAVARERAMAFGASTHSPDVLRVLARAATYERRRRPAAESEWHSAAVAAARRRGDASGSARATERWVERLVDAGRFARAVAVANRAVADATDPAAAEDMAVLAARAHLAAAEVTRAETLALAAIASGRLRRGLPSSSAVSVHLEVLFWQGRWREMRTILGEWANGPEKAQWTAALDWADAGNRNGSAADVRPMVPALRAGPRIERGLAHAIAVAVRGTLDHVEASELAWFEDVVRRERLRGITRFSEGMTDMQMLRDMAALLAIVQECDDEAAGLARVCEWIRTAAGASAVGVVSLAGAPLAGDGLRTLGLDRLDGPDLSRWCAPEEPTLDEAETHGTARAPVRFAGVPHGCIAAIGSVARGHVLLTAVHTAAMVSGALVKSRIDGLLAASRGEALASEILGASPAMRSVRSHVARVAVAPFPVVIEGESGTGKELVARALHRQSGRSARAFAALNCAALTDELVEAELFGHARGAFTHAVNARAGLFEEAHHGTLFLDEVGELSPRAQAKLLRALQEGEIRRVGENESRAVDVRVIAATNRPLAMLAAEGRFRDDLMFRLSVVKIALPPLRERSEDVPQLAIEFWRSAARRVGTRATLGPDAIALLAQLPWPGNVRQLQNAMAALAVSAPTTGRVGARLVRLVLDGTVDTSGTDEVPLVEARRQVERRVIAAALAKHTDSRAEAARVLGLTRQGLSKALRRLGLAEPGAA